LLLAGRVSAGGEALQCPGGLRVEFSDQGRVTRLDIGSTRLPLKTPGGLAVADFQRPPALVNLVPNPGFEEGAHGWRLEKGQTVDTAIAHGGRASMRLEVPGPQPGTTNLGVTVAVKPNTAYRVEMWVRLHSVQKRPGSGPGFYYSELDDQGRHVGKYQVGVSLPPRDDQWMPVSWSMVTRPDTRKLLLRGTIYHTTGTLWLDDFLIAEAVEMPYLPAAGKLERQSDGGLCLRARWPGLGLALEATFRSWGKALRIDGVISDLTGRDRAVGLRFGLPLDLAGWRWYDDAEDFQAIAPDGVYENTYACEAGEGACSRHPWSALSGPSAGLSMALPLAQGPRAFILKHNQRAPETSLTFYFGLAKDAGQNPSRAPFSLVLYAHDPAWGMRSAMERYYRFFPESFRKRPRYEAYLNYASEETYRPASHQLSLASGEPASDASDFGEGYQFLWHIHGCYDYHQFPTDDRSMPKDDLVKAWLAQAAGRPIQNYTPEPETLKKLVYGPGGEIRYIFDTQYWHAREGYNVTDKPGWGMNFRVNEDPGVSPFLADMSRKVLEKYAAQPGRRPFAACLTADAIDGYFHPEQGLDYRREHFRTTLPPLTFGRQSLEPAIFNTIWDFDAKAWWPLTERYQVVTYGNGNVPSAMITMPFIDIAMIEGRWDRNSHPREERFWRACAYQKIWRFWCLNTGWYDTPHVLDPGEVSRTFGEGLASAIFPPLDTVARALGSLEPVRGAYRQYVPAIEELSAAGWEPVPHATAGEGVVVERFGSAAQGLYFTLRNYDSRPKQVSLCVHRGGLGIPQDQRLVAVDLVPGTPEIVPLEGDLLGVRVEADNSRAFCVGSREQVAARGLRQAVAALDKIDRLFASELDQDAARLLDQGRQLARPQATNGRGGRQLLEAAEDLQDLAGRLEAACKTRSPIDLAKLLLRLRTAAALVPMALLEVQSHCPRLFEDALRGQAVAVRWELTGAPCKEPAKESLQVLSPWPALAGGAARNIRQVRPGCLSLEAALRVPAAPDRFLLPFALVYRGQAQGRPFTLATPVDVGVGQSARIALEPDHVVRDKPRSVHLRLENRQAEPARVELRLVAPKYVELKPVQLSIDLPGGGAVAREIAIHATGQCMRGRVWIPYTIRSAAAEHNASGMLFLKVDLAP
jgi:hypothetical protein